MTVVPAEQAGPAEPAKFTSVLTLIHRDAQLLALHKPAGLLVHPSALDAHERDDVLSRLRAQGGGPVWPLHRLDKGTSGVLLLARDASTARQLGELFAGRQPGLDKPRNRSWTRPSGPRWGALASGATTLRAHAREEEQRRQRAPVRLNRVRSAVTQEVKVVVAAKARIHAV